MKSAQQVQQDPELATSKHVASRLAAHRELARVRPALHLPLCTATPWVTFSNNNVPLVLGDVRQWGTAEMIV